MIELVNQRLTQIGTGLAVCDFNQALIDSFLLYADVKPASIATYRKAISRLLDYFRTNGITYPKRQDIINYKQSLQNGKHLVRGVWQPYKPTTIQNYIVASHVFFGWLCSQNIYPNIAAHVKGAKLDRGFKKDYLTADQVKAILETARAKTNTLQGLRNYAMFTLMVTCGLRTIEVERLNVEDMRTIGGNSVLFVQGKGRSEKTEYVKLSAPVEKILRAYLAMRGDKAEALFTSTSNNGSGKRMSTRAISGIIKSMMIDAGYDKDTLTAHSLRHTAVTLALLAGCSIEEVQQFARHLNISTTMIYNHALDQAKNRCASVVTDSIF